VDRATVAVYEERGEEWAAGVGPVRSEEATRFAATVAAGGVRLDVGCGTGRYLSDLGAPAVGIDAAWRMLRAARRAQADAVLVRGDLEALPFGRGRIAGAWANMSYQHIERTALPAALAELHRVLVVGAPVDVQVLGGDYEGHELPGDRVPGRFFAGWHPEALVDVCTGAGLEVGRAESVEDVVRVSARRARTLADVVGPHMRLLVVGLNPSIYSADAGVGFARPGNRFWPAALAAGLATRDRDPWHALRFHGMGMTDLVKRATVGAAELRPDEYRRGLARVERLVRWLAPRAVCMVGLTGWRVAFDARAIAGEQTHRIGGRPVYLMPNTSGANAHATAASLSDHLRAAAALADRA